MIFRQYLQESIGQEAADNAASGGIAGGEKISRSTLEDAARMSTLKGHGTPEERFWQRQQGQAETIAIGKNYIDKVCASFGDFWDTAANVKKAAPKDKSESKKEL